jgi:hypothetical protein
MRLTKHFFLEEFLKSQTGTRLGIDNTPTPVVTDNLKHLCVHVLEPVRIHYGKAVYINSGYRSPELNKAIGGVVTSQHCTGHAADIEVPGIPTGDLAKWVAENLDFDQVILECYTPGKPGSGWVHVSYKTSGNRKSTLTATVVAGRMIYNPGIRS